MGEGYTYAGFWLRVWAALIDAVLWAVIAVPILVSAYGWEYFESEALVSGPLDFLVSYVFPAIAVILFWISKSATPGKMAIHAKIIDERTGGKPSSGQFIGRYFGYIVAMIPLMLGIIWVAFDAKKQGWHDKLAGTAVVRRVQQAATPVVTDEELYKARG